MTELSLLDSILQETPIMGVMLFAIWMTFKSASLQNKETNERLDKTHKENLEQLERYVLKPYSENFAKMSSLLDKILSISESTEKKMSVLTESDVKAFHADHLWKKEHLEQIKKNTELILETIKKH